MNINATLIAEMISFAIFVWFTMKFVWPPLVNALEERKQKIADGLAAADRGKHEQELAEKRALEVLHEAKQEAAEIIARAEKRAATIVEESKDEAKVEGERIIAAKHADFEQEVNQFKEALRAQLATLAVTAAGRILEREVDAAAHSDVIDRLAAEI